jgi:carbonic anhydrase
LKTKISLLALIILTTGCATTTQHTSHNQHWGYTGHEGPEYWGTLDPKYSTCDKGLNQSPINLTGFIESDLSPLELEYKLGGHEILNNGHTIQVNYQSGSKLGINGHSYELKQFHFHSPSENHINGKSYPMEMHLVHADTKGNLAVVAVVFEEGNKNETLKEIWNTMPSIAGNKKTLPSIVSVDGLLPDNREYYRFNGSLTTPPCTEGVVWLVMKQPVAVTKGQIKQFTNVMHQPTNRPVQAVNARPILK